MIFPKSSAAFLLALMALVGGLFTQQWRSLTFARQQVEHTQHVIEQSRLLATAMIDAETWQRGFIITQDEKFLEPYRDSIAAIPGLMKNLKSLIADNAAQIDRVATIDSLWRERSGELQNNVDLTSRNRFPDVRAQIAQGHGRVLMDQVRARIGEVIQGEQTLLTERLLAASRAEDTTRWLMILALAVAAVGLLASLFVVHRDNRMLKDAVERERLATVSLEQARGQLSEAYARTQADLTDTSRMLAAAVASAPIVVWRQDADLVYRWFSGEAMGQPASWFIGKSDHDILPDRMKFVVISSKTAALQSGKAQTYEVAAPTEHGEEWYDVRVEPTFDSGGAVNGIAGVGIVITERKKREQNIRLLMREIAHRSKNILAVVQAMARQTAAANPEPGAFVERFASRLEALAATHSLLIDEGWAGADIGDLIRSQLGHQLDLVGKQIFLNGPRVNLPAEISQNIGLALHELSTNAAKYGALSVLEGRVDVAWTLGPPDDGKRELVLSWVERNGPTVQPPKRKGFGQIVIERTVSRAVNGVVELNYDPKGFSWRLKFNLDDAAHADPVEPDASADSARASSIQT